MPLPLRLNLPLMDNAISLGPREREPSSPAPKPRTSQRHVITLAGMLFVSAAVLTLRGLHGSTNFSSLPSVTQVLGNVFFLNGLSIGDLRSVNVPSWSISCEMMVYALFCVVTLFSWSRFV